MSPSRSEALRVDGLGGERRDKSDQLIHVERLRDVPSESSFDAELLVTLERVARDRHSGDCTTSGHAPNALEELVTVHPRHADVDEDHFGRPRLKNVQDLGSAERGANRRSLLNDELLEDVQTFWVVIRQKDASALERQNYTAW